MTLSAVGMKILVFAVIAIETFALAQAQEIDKKKLFNAPSLGIIEGLSTDDNNGRLQVAPGTAVDRFGNSKTTRLQRNKFTQ